LAEMEADLNREKRSAEQLKQMAAASESDLESWLKTLSDDPKKGKKTLAKAMYRSLSSAQKKTLHDGQHAIVPKIKELKKQKKPLTEEALKSILDRLHEKYGLGFRADVLPPAPCNVSPMERNLIYRGELSAGNNNPSLRKRTMWKS
jgi:integrase